MPLIECLQFAVITIKISDSHFKRHFFSITNCVGFHLPKTSVKANIIKKSMIHNENDAIEFFGGKNSRNLRIIFSLKK